MSDAQPWWWLSFADDRKPSGEQFLGVCLVRGPDFIGAVRNAHVFGINPGGQVRGREVPRDLVVPEWAQKRLLTKEDALRLDGEFGDQMAALAASMLAGGT